MYMLYGFKSIQNRVRIVVFGLEVVKKPLFIGASHVIIILQRIFATLLQRFIEKSTLQQLQLFPLASKLKMLKLHLEGCLRISLFKYSIFIIRFSQLISS